MSDLAPQTENSSGQKYFDGPTEMHGRVRAFDWSRTSVGPVESWPQSLRALVKMLLASQYPMVLTWGPDYLQFYNDAYSKLIGDKHPAALGLDIRITLAEAWDTLGPMIQKVMQTGVANWTPALQLVIERSGFREEAYFSVSHSPAEDDNGQIVGMLGVCSEVTPQVLSERRLSLLRELGTHAGETDSVATTCGHLAAAIADYPLDVPFALLYLREPDGQTLRLHGVAGLEENSAAAPTVADLNQTETLWPLARAAAGETVVLDDVARRVTIHGGPLQEPVRAALVMPIAGAAQLPLGVLVVAQSPNHAQDERSRSFCELLASQVSIAVGNAQAYEEERRRAQALAELDRAKTEFFSNVSHEFRTPLTLMLGPLEEVLGRADKLPVEDREQLEVVHRNSVRLLKLVNTLLSFSRVEAGRAEAMFVPTDLAAFTGELASGFRSAVEKVGLRLRLDCPPLPEPIYVDRDMWEKIVLNLLSNALKFTFEGEIAVSLQARDGAVVLQVRDTGPGIEPEELTHLFERFHRVRGVRSRSHEGTGIGLSLVQELARLHGGQVQVESTLGQGTTFTVTIPPGNAHLPAEQVRHDALSLPAAPGATAYIEEALSWLPSSPENTPARLPGAQSTLLPSSGAVPLRFPQARILLADDNADMREYVSRLLSKRYTVEAVSNGQQALEAARRQVPDLVLADVMMPELDGFGLIQALRSDAHTAGVPVVLLSARAGEEARVEGLNQGADDYLVKPFRARELLARVDANLRQSLLRREVAHRQVADILESITDAFYALDREWRFTYVNKQCEKYYGRRREELLGKVVWDEFPMVIGSAFEHEYRRVMAERETAHFEVFSPFSERWIEVHVYPSPEGVAVYFRDVTERKTTEEERERLLREAREANRMKDDFLATVSHELRTPLTAIIGWANILSSGRLPEDDARHALETIQRNAQAQSRIVNDILDISRVVSGQLRLNVQPIHLNALIEAAVDAVRPAAEAKELHLKVLLDHQIEDLPGDPDRLQQVLWNLLSNAVKFTPNGGTVQVRAEERSGEVAIEVSDSGQGIAPDFLPFVFERFRQADMTSTRTHGGLGLGLAIVRQLVELHGGNVEVHSAGRGQGATFIVSLPMPPEHSEAPATPRPQAPALTRELENFQSRERLDGVRVLLADDEVDARELLTTVLEQSGATVRAVGSMTEALQELEEFRPTVVISDLGMPGEDGYALIRRLRTLEAGIGEFRVPAVALTAYGRAEDQQRALAAGFQQHVLKPIEPEELVRIIADLTAG